MSPEAASQGTEVVVAGDVVLADPYRHLEVDSPETISWQTVQDERAQAALYEWEHSRALEELLQLLPTGRSQAAPRHAGAQWFWTAVPLGADRAVLYSGSKPFESDGRVLVDPRQRPGESLWEYWPSPDGRWLVYAAMAGAAEGGELRLIDVATGAAVCPPSLFSTWTRLSWMPDSGGYYFNGITLDNGTIDSAVFYQPVADTRAVRQPIDHGGGDCYPTVSADGRHVFLSTGVRELRPAYRLNLDDQRWRPFLPDIDFHLHGTVVGDRYVAVTNLDADRGRVVTVPLPEPEAVGRWQEIVPESDAAIRALSVVGDRVVLSELLDGASRLRIVDLDGGPAGVVRVPATAVTASGQAPMIGVPMVHVSGGHDEITFLASSPARPPEAFRYGVSEARLEVIGRRTAALPATTTTLRHAVADDGTRLSCYLSHLDGLDRHRPQPTLVLAYGGFDIPNVPRYSPAVAAFVLSGGIVAHAIVRGGGEYGRAWWQAARRHHKQTTFDDLYTVVHHLIADGITEPALLGLQGGSAGGLTAGVAITQRPDLFSAVVATAPALDTLRYPVHTIAATVAAVRDELGDPDDAGDATVLASYSPYHNVKPGADYPAVLAVAAEHDVRTPPWHSRKFIARLQASGTRRPALLRIWKKMGHGTGAPATTERSAEWLSFIMCHLGMTPARSHAPEAGERDRQS